MDVCETARRVARVLALEAPPSRAGAQGPRTVHPSMRHDVLRFSLFGAALPALFAVPALAGCWKAANGDIGTDTTVTEGGAASDTATPDGSTFLTDGSIAPRGSDASAPVDSAPAALMRGPTPPSSTSMFPFPQNRQVAGVTYPSAYQNSDVQNAYAKWKTDLITSSGAGMRVQRLASDPINPDGCTPTGSTVSEGIGYGMLIAVYMDDETTFDNLWLYEQQNLDGNGLMNWAPGPGASGPDCSGGATDADEDMAFALVMAWKQWGGKGMLSQTYEATAIAQIQKIWQFEIYNYSYPRAGDGSWATKADLNVSYFAPAYYRTFAAVDPKACEPDAGFSNSCDGWWDVVNQSYATINDSLNSANGNQSNGLVPAWCDDSSGAPCKQSGSYPFIYQYDSCRTPFRLGLDAIWNGNSAAQAYVAKTSAFFAPIGASSIADGYALNGTAQPANPGKLSAPFIGPATVGAMSPSGYQQFVNAGYAVLAEDNAFAGGEYYASSWTVLSLLMLTGNFLDYTHETPAQ